MEEKLRLEIEVLRKIIAGFIAMEEDLTKKQYMQVQIDYYDVLNTTLN